MVSPPIIAFSILALALVLFAWGRWRYDVVALLALLAVVLAGLIPANEALVGFGHPAVITVIAVLAISRALRTSGAVDVISRYLEPFTENTLLHIASLSAAVAVASAFINNVGALAVMMPVALASAAQRGRSPAILLMPLAFGSILGGLMTLIGTPPNIIIATFRAEAMGEPFRMFDFSFVGVPIAIMGVIFVALIGWRLIPKERQGQTSPEQIFEIDDYIVEVRIQSESPLIDKRVTQFEAMTDNAVMVASLVKPDGEIVKAERWHPMHEGDVLIIKADPIDLPPILSEHKLELVPDADVHLRELKPGDTAVVEAVVMPDSSLLYRSPQYLRRHSGNMLQVLAIARQGHAVLHRLPNEMFKAGDILLLRSESPNYHETIADLGLLPLPERDLKLGVPRNLALALAIFIAAIGSSALGFVPIAIALIGAVVAYALLDILPVRDLYRFIDWPVAVLLAAMIPVGRALELSGGTDIIAGGIVNYTESLPVWATLTLIMVVTMTLSDLINNAATALVMAPIAVAVAGQMGVSPDPLLMAVAIGASCAFLTPIGHQSNTLVMGPGGYQFTDYWRMGLPLEILIVVISIPLILVAWPL